MEDVLEHYGVKGMKWGVRKDVGGSSSRGGGSSTAGTTKRPAASGAQSPGSDKKAKKKYTEAELRERVNKLRLERDYAQIKAEKRRMKTPGVSNSRVLGRKRPGEMTDVELRKLIDRIRLEKDFASLTAETAKKSIGKQIVADIAQNTAREFGKTVASNGAKYFARKALERRGDKGAELAEALFGSGKKKK